MTYYVVTMGYLWDMQTAEEKDEFFSYTEAVSYIQDRGAIKDKSDIDLWFSCSEWYKITKITR